MPLYPVIQAASSVAKLICDADVHSTLGVVVVCSGSGSGTRRVDWNKKPNVTSRVEAKEAPRSFRCRRSDIADGRLQKRSEKRC